MDRELETSNGVFGNIGGSADGVCEARVEGIIDMMDDQGYVVTFCVDSEIINDESHTVLTVLATGFTGHSAATASVFHIMNNPDLPLAIDTGDVVVVALSPTNVLFRDASEVSREMIAEAEADCVCDKCKARLGRD